MLQLETPGTLRARELGEIYMILASDADDDGAEGEERLPALHSLATLVSNQILYFLSNQKLATLKVLKTKVTQY